MTSRLGAGEALRRNYLLPGDIERRCALSMNLRTDLKKESVEPPLRATIFPSTTALIHSLRIFAGGRFALVVSDVPRQDKLGIVAF